VKPALAAGGGNPGEADRGFSVLRPTSTTSAPARARPSAIAPQSSPVPPMTTATRPDRPKSELRYSGELMSEKEDETASCARAKTRFSESGSSSVKNLQRISEPGTQSVVVIGHE
jgi:hypothetical protein